MVARVADVAAWFLLGSSHVRFDHWQSKLNTNKGDIAVRETIKSQLREAFSGCDVQFTELKWGQLKEHMSDDLNRSLDLLVIGGSGYIRPTKARNLPSDMIEDAKAFARLTCVKVAYGIGWNYLLDTNTDSAPPLSAIGYEKLEALLRTIDLMSVRDHATQALIQEVSGSRPLLVGDPALFYSGLFPAQTTRESRKKLHVGLNMALHGADMARRLEVGFDMDCAFLKALSREHEIVFHYVQHTQSESVIPLMLASRGIFVRWHNPPAEKLIDFYRSLDIHICKMMHSSVLSFSARIPTLNFVYDIKNKGLFEIMGMSGFYFSSWGFDHEMALAAAKKLIDRRRDVRNQIDERIGELRSDLAVLLRNVAVAVAERQA